MPRGRVRSLEDRTRTIYDAINTKALAQFAARVHALPYRRTPPRPGYRSESIALLGACRYSSRYPASCSSPRRCPPGRCRDRVASADHRQHSHPAAKSGCPYARRVGSARSERRKAPRSGCWAWRSWRFIHCRCHLPPPPRDREGRSR